MMNTQTRSPAPAVAPEDVRLGSGEMFDAIAHRYDFLNRIISLGIDQRWRRRTVDALRVSAGHHVLDVATGTADLAILTAKRTGAQVTGVDPSVNMLKHGQVKVDKRGLPISLVCGDAQDLTFADDTFDGATIAFGIRNVPDRARGLAEMNRVLKPGARLAVLELSEPRAGILGPLARFHIHHVVPFLGALISGNKEYRYLQKSIADFPPPQAFASLMTDAGFRVTEVTPLTFGVCCLYVGEAS